MSKRIGNYVGFSTFLEQDGGNKGVWNLIDQFFFKGKGEWTLFSATGGTQIINGTDTYHVFTSSGTLTVTDVGSATAMEILVVGGGSGGNRGGGGGAGGIIQAPAAPISATAYSITIGSASATGGDGNPSVFTHPLVTLTGYGGGSGGGAGNLAPDAANPGGSGGGAGIDYPGITGAPGTQPGHPATPFTTNKYGNPGGNAPTGGSPYQAGAGGGGAGGVGANGNRRDINPTTSTGGAGGAGQPFVNFVGPVLSPAISGPTVPIIGPTGLFGGGGGGGNNLNPPSPAVSAPVGGSGGGGNGAALDGAVGGNGNSYGGGGGGYEAEGSPAAGSTGFQGIVIVRIY
jgi:hypothetical protein